VNEPVLRRGVFGVLKMTPFLRGQDSRPLASGHSRSKRHGATFFTTRLVEKKPASFRLVAAPKNTSDHSELKETTIAIHVPCIAGHTAGQTETTNFKAPYVRTQKLTLRP